ncbi:class III lanthionine synthetase LanKC [Luedemannella flava]|uniref:Class III lanthionine synthetase LanKC n=1 Tax=Luedemannella flava TaxID=349316 RepID=A0ABN2M0N0_9ACTN
MDDRYEAFCLASPVFYDVLHSDEAARPTFPTADEPLPAGWRRRTQDDWIVFIPPRRDGPALPAQGWKIHVSATLDNAERVLTVVRGYCIGRGIEFKFLRSPAALLARVSKYAPRGFSGKLVTIYPVDDGACESILTELGELLDGEPNPYILSDLRWGAGPLFVRYGAFASRHCVGPNGQVVPAIADGDGVLVPDRRGPTFYVPPWVSLPDFLAPALAARNAVSVTGMPYTVDRVLHFSNGGGIYVGTDTRTGARVVLKEGRPHAGIDARGDDAVTRVEREYATLRHLAGIPGIPAVYDLFWLGEHRFFAMEHVDGLPLSRALAARYPLTDLTATPDAFAGYTDWALGVYRQVEAAIEAMHGRGVVYGDMHLFNVMVREDGTAALLDFEVAAPVGQATRPGLGNQGFSAPRGTTGFDIDRYGLACLRLALFLPITNVLWLHRPKARHYAEIIAGHFPVPAEHLTRAVEVIAPRPEPSPTIEPDTEAWPQLRDKLATAILASATPERDDRLFPGDIQQFAIGGLGLTCGAAGVLYALHATGAGRHERLEQWLLDRARHPAPGTRPGLYDGLHGVAYVLDELGHRQLALDTVDICLREDWTSLGPDLHGGLAGIGLNLLRFADHTGEPSLRLAAHRAAELVAERIGPDEESVPPLSGRDNPYAGLMRGSSGAALLLMRAYDDTGDAAYLDRAAVALGQDLRRSVVRGNGTMEVNEGWRTMPYLEVGSVGVGLALHEYLARRADDRFADALRAIDRTAQSPMYALPGLFSGRAGILLYLAARGADTLMAKQIRGLAWHAVPYEGGLAFPGTALLRLSMDLGTGTAGVLLALGAVLHDGPVHLPLLASSTGRPTAAPQSPAPTGAGPAPLGQ